MAAEPNRKRFLKQIKDKLSNGGEPETLEEACELARSFRQEARRQGYNLKKLKGEKLEVSLRSIDDVVDWYLSLRVDRSGVRLRPLEDPKNLEALPFRADVLEDIAHATQAR